MTPFRWGIVGFWVVVGLALYWQFHSYDTKLENESEAHPVQQHYWGPLAATYAPEPAPKVAKVQESAYWVTKDPSGQLFTVHLTLKNVGGAKATGVTANVAPFVGSWMFDPDGGGHTAQTGQVIAQDPVAANSQWLVFPDLEAGKDATVTAQFTGRPDLEPSADPSPKIVFSTAK